MQKRRYNTAIETAGNVKNDIVQSVAPFVDLFLYDIKAFNPEGHKHCTGSTNEQILENAQWLKEQCPEKVLFRMPVVLGYNDFEVNSVAKFSSPIKVELLPYHQTGIGKYPALGRQYYLDSVQPPSLDYLRGFIKNNETVFCSIAGEARKTFLAGPAE